MPREAGLQIIYPLAQLLLCGVGAEFRHIDSSCSYRLNNHKVDATVSIAAVSTTVPTAVSTVANYSAYCNAIDLKSQMVWGTISDCVSKLI